MAFDFGAALTSVGQLYPAADQARQNIIERQRQAQQFALSQRQGTAQAISEEQRNKQWVPMRSYTSGDGSQHTVYFTPQGIQDLVDQPSPLQQRQQYIDTLKKMGITLPQEQLGEFFLTGGVKNLPRERITKGDIVNVDPGISPTGWARGNYDLDTGQLLYWEPSNAPRYDVATQTSGEAYDPASGMYKPYSNIRQPILPPPLGGSGPPPMVPPAATNLTPQMRALQPQQGGRVPAVTGQPAGTGPAPISSAGAIAQLAQPHPQGGERGDGSNTPPSVYRFQPMNSQIRALGDATASVMQQFVGTGNDPIWNNSWMLDQPQLRDAINKALTVSMNPVPTNPEHPGLGQSVVAATGLMGFLQTQTNRQKQQARADVERLGGMQALQFVDRLAELKGSIPALRAYSRASAAQGSIAPLIQESPVLNTSSSADFRLRSSYILRTMAGALESDPAVNPQYVRWIQKQADDAQSGARMNPSRSVQRPSAPPVRGGVRDFTQVSP